MSWTRHAIRCRVQRPDTQHALSEYQVALPRVNGPTRIG
jgi:hypothetical protein